jgi:UDP-N-acetylmuramate dehydrogenase
MISQDLKETLKRIVSGSVLFDEPMSHYTSMGVGGTADIFLSPASIEDLQTCISCLSDNKIPFVPVGNCTNLIVRDGGYRGAVISLKGLDTIAVSKEEGESVLLRAETGAHLSRLVELSVRKSLAGMEFCAGIPGSVGGGVKMNAGAYGKELKDVVAFVSLINGEGIITDVARDNLQFEYRNLILPEGTVIVSAVFDLREGSQANIRERISYIMGMRKKKHPLAYRSAGSVFKNPPDEPAGKIIDEVGLKGFRIGDAMVSKIHGNFIVNLGKATAKDILLLMDIIQKKVLEERGILLEPEIKIIGDEV